MSEYGGRTLRRVLQLQCEMGEVLFTRQRIAFITYQLLRALVYLNSAEVSLSLFFGCSHPGSSHCSLATMGYLTMGHLSDNAPRPEAGEHRDDGRLRHNHSRPRPLEERLGGDEHSPVGQRPDSQLQSPGDSST